MVDVFSVVLLQYINYHDGFSRLFVISAAEDMYDDFGNSGKVPEKVGQTEIEKEVAEHEFSYKETVESEDVKENENPVQENLFEEEESNVTHYWKRD